MTWTRRSSRRMRSVLSRVEALHETVEPFDHGFLSLFESLEPIMHQLE